MMIKTNYHYISTKSQFDKYYDDIMKLPYWVYDVETNGTDSHMDKVILAQFGNKDVQYLIDTRELSLKPFEERFEDESFIKLGQYLQFDYKMTLGTFGIHTEGLRDTMIGDQLLSAGLRSYGFSLEDLCLRYLNIKIDKEMQTSFVNHNGPFTRRQLEYAALDCIYPHMVWKVMGPMLQKEGLLDVFKIECNAIPAFADIEHYGILLDQEAWMKNILDEQVALEKAKQGFMEALADKIPTSLFGVPDVNPNSPAQVLEIFKTLYPGEMVNRDGKEGTGEEILEEISKKHGKPPEVMALLKIRGHEKKIGTYGYSFLNAVHPKTHRVHPRIAQIGTATGRPAGKKPNMLNIPQEKRYRHPWIAPEGRAIITNDYGACELRIMASESGDPVMCKGFNEGKDYHTYTVSEFMTDPNEYEVEYIPHPQGEVGKGKYGDFILDENGQKKKNPHYGMPVRYELVVNFMRNVAKAINFGLAYGMGPGKLAHTLDIAKDLAKTYVNKFNTTFKVLVGWLKTQQENGVEKGYAVTKLGRKRYFEVPQKPLVVEYADQFQRIADGYHNGKPRFKYHCEALGQTLNYNPAYPWDENLPEKVKKYYTKIASIKREAGNSPIQGANADITKIAMYELRKFIRQYEKEHNNNQYVAHILLQVYDELLMECPEDLAPFFAKKMDEIMKAAGERVIDKVPVEVGAKVAKYWVK